MKIIQYGHAKNPVAKVSYTSWGSCFLENGSEDDHSAHKFFEMDYSKIVACVEIEAKDKAAVWIGDKNTRPVENGEKLYAECIHDGVLAGNRIPYTSENLLLFSSLDSLVTFAKDEKYIDITWIE